MYVRRVPLPAWFDGRDDVARFLSGSVFATPWRLVPVRASGRVVFVITPRAGKTILKAATVR